MSNSTLSNIQESTTENLSWFSLIAIASFKKLSAPHLICIGCGITPAIDFKPRVIAHFEGVAIPLEAAHIKWHENI